MASAIAKDAPAALLGPCGSHAIILARSSLSQDKWVRIAVTLTRQGAQARKHGRALCIMPCAAAALRRCEHAADAAGHGRDSPRTRRARARLREKREPRALQCMRARRQGPRPRAGRTGRGRAGQGRPGHRKRRRRRRSPDGEPRSAASSQRRRPPSRRRWRRLPVRAPAVARSPCLVTARRQNSARPAEPLQLIRDSSVPAAEHVFFKLCPPTRLRPAQSADPGFRAAAPLALVHVLDGPVAV